MGIGFVDSWSAHQVEQPKYLRKRAMTLYQSWATTTVHHGSDYDCGSCSEYEELFKNEQDRQVGHKRKGGVDRTANLD